MKHIIEDLELIRFELDTCLLSSFASVLRHQGLDDTTLLGTTWEFNFPLKNIRNEEYYLPITRSSLAETLVPDAKLKSAWKTATTDQAGWEMLREEILAGFPAPIAVDNFHLPFRPAYHDVHSKHLIIAYGFDEAAGNAYVLDATPPSFNGTVSIEDLQRARGSINPKEGQRDHFFTNSNVSFAMLKIRATGKPASTSIQKILVNCVRRSMTGMKTTDSSPSYLIGLEGIRQLAERSETSPLEVAQDIFIYAGTLMAQRARLSIFLARVGEELASKGIIALSEEIQKIAYRWGTIRILCSREAKERPATLGPRLASQLHSIANTEQQALIEFETQASSLRRTSENVYG